MRLSVKETGAARHFYIIQSTYLNLNKKRSTKIVEKIGTEDELRRKVNHFSDKLLSDSYLIAVFTFPLLKIFYRGHVTQSLLYTTSVIVSLYVIEDCLPSFLTTFKTPPVNSFLFQVGEETLTPGIVPRVTYLGEALLS